MPTECNLRQFEFEGFDRRQVVADFEGGDITSNAGALLLGQVDRGLGLIRRFATCFTDRRDPRYVEHQLETLIGQRVFGLALGYEDLNDHDELRKDPAFAVLARKLEPVLRTDCEALAGKSTLNRLELAKQASKYHKITVDPEKVGPLFDDLFLEAHERAPKRIILDIDATDIPLHGHQEGRFFHGYYDAYCYLPLYIFCDTGTCWRRRCAVPTSTQQPAPSRTWHGSSARSASAGRRRKSSSGPIPALRARN